MQNNNEHEIDVSRLCQDILVAMNNANANLKNLNLMILGKTGVGKSTFVNTLFGKDLVKTGGGKRVTERITLVEEPGFPISIYDTPGLELGGDFSKDNLLNEVISIIEKQLSFNDISKAVHCLLYCVSTPSHRFEATEEEFIREFLNKSKANAHNVPVIIVLTQSISQKDTDELKKAIEDCRLDVKGIIPVLAKDFEIDGTVIKKAFGMKDLSDKLIEELPEEIGNTFIRMQKVDIEVKEAIARKIVNRYAAGAAAIGLTPIPFSDAILLTGEQVAMLGQICSIFDIKTSDNLLKTLIKGVLGIAGVTAIGRSVVSNLLKLVPGMGSVVGGAISGATAAALTSALGYAFIKAVRQAKEQSIDPNSDSKSFMDIFAELFKQNWLNGGSNEK